MRLKTSSRFMITAPLTLLLLLLLTLPLLLTGCSSHDEQTTHFAFTFDADDEGWTADFVDLPADADPSLYALQAGWSELPEPLRGGSMLVSGHNMSDDLFMYLQTYISGFAPDTTYQVTFSLDLATNVPQGMMGIGGSPGESVYVKAGAVDFEPAIVTGTDGWLRLDIDMGNQASGGEDMIVLGNIANPNLDPATATGAEYALMNLNNDGVPFTVTSDQDGGLWVIVGTDSGFEGITTIYYDSITIDLAVQ